ncbi:MAG: hypothetical protein Q8L23_15160 [Caulobacter sp.]|nr:hypothetical protein [Caulobacter sp.]
MSEDQPENLTGVWHGLYMYPAALEAGAFVATVMDVGAGLTGGIHETAGDEGLPPSPRNASIAGFREGQTVVFVKRYDGSGGWSHAVNYHGALSSDRSEIEGAWDIPGVWSGRFLMIRSRGAPDAVRRKAFQGA